MTKSSDLCPYCHAWLIFGSDHAPDCPAFPQKPDPQGELLRHAAEEKIRRLIVIEKLQQFEFWGGERNLVNIKSGEFGYSQAYVHAANAKAREDALLGALKLTVRYMEYLHGEAGCSLDCCDCVLAGDYAAVKDCIREIEATRD